MKQYLPSLALKNSFQFSYAAGNAAANEPEGWQWMYNLNLNFNKIYAKQWGKNVKKRTLQKYGKTICKLCCQAVEPRSPAAS